MRFTRQVHRIFLDLVPITKVGDNLNHAGPLFNDLRSPRQQRHGPCRTRHKLYMWEVWKLLMKGQSATTA